MKIKVIELFAGVGGFRVGLNNIKSFNMDTGLAIEKGNWDFVWANQWEPSRKAQHAYECYVKRFGESDNHSNIDIEKVNKNDILDHDLLVGGFPCQDYSVARSLKGEKGIQGKKGVLWWSIMDVIKEKKSPFILLENVDRLLKSPASQRGRDFAIMLKTLNDEGYIVEWRVINAADYGMPQKRKRVFIFAYHTSTEYGKKILNKPCLKDYCINKGLFNSEFKIEDSADKVQLKSLEAYKDILDVSDNYKDGKFLESGLAVKGLLYQLSPTPIREKTYPLKKVIKDAPKPVSYDNYYVEDKDIDKWKYLKGAKKVERTRKDGGTYIYSEGTMSFPENIDLPARTLLTSEGTTNRSTHVVLENSTKRYRKLTEIECEMIQMFPPDWTNTGMTSRNRYFMMGNALVTGVVSRLAKSIYDIVSFVE